ncbi:MAG: excinuclease ABC subunit UvrA [Pirellulales bacterium]|nr:excinuclease ABC subunit UvrA [Pirellulales bacterium]
MSRPCPTAPDDGPPLAADRDEHIRIRGARTHNLRNVDLDLPRNRFVVVTGPSGSGKSSLAYDTLYAEGQRQYIESLSVYARQFLHQLERPDVDLIDGLQPTISIDQRSGSQNPRSTVATVTEIYDYLRLLYARLGEPFCYQCGAAIRQQTPDQILEDLMALPEGTRTMILAPMIRGRKGRHAEVFEAIGKAGLLRARVDGEVVDVHAPPELAPRRAHDIEAVIDRIVIREGIRTRLTESIKLAIRQSEGLVLAAYEEKPPRPDEGTASESPGAAAPGVWRDVLYSTLYACPFCKISYEELEPRTFSFNSPYGVCPTCEGLGVRVEFDPELVLPNPKLSLAGGAIAPWRGAAAAAERKRKAALREFMSSAGFRWNTPLERLAPETLRALLRGDGRKFPGVLVMLEKELATTTSETHLKRLSALRGGMPCPECGGSRLRAEARGVRVGDKAIHELTAMTVTEARTFVESLAFHEEDMPLAEPIVSELVARLAFLDKVGLEYLTLDRPADTLSGGELQRVRLATGLGSGLVGVCYVLDEPTIGLHPRDNQRLLGALRDLHERGNTVLVVEHDEAVIRQADWLVDLGPGAGRHGGQIVAQGTPDDVAANPDSPTGRYLAGRDRIAVPQKRRRVAKTRVVTLQGVSTNNLKGVTVQFPLGALVCVTGVSGSGKSSLLNETLARALVRRLGGVAPKPGPHEGLRGASQIDKVVQIDQSPIGRTPRSNPATYTGAFDEIRRVFANTRAARQRGYKVGRFSFNVKGGRCPECQGQGQIKIEMNFLPDLYVTCPECNGRRFNHQTLQVHYRDRSIADVLDMRVDDAAGFFENFPAIARILQNLHEVGLGYLTLGQSSTTLSGGEAQRIKLATELGRPDSGKTLYILDEPTTGLHFDDTRMLLDVLSRLVDLGNTVIVIEHNLDVIKTADWIIDLGPEGGQAGGEVVAVGTPEQLAAAAASHTGRYLRDVLAQAGQIPTPPEDADDNPAAV